MKLFFWLFFFANCESDLICIPFTTLTAHGCLVVFTVDPQDEAERKEQRLAVIADHLGFSWTGESLLSQSSQIIKFEGTKFILFDLLSQSSSKTHTHTI